MHNIFTTLWETNVAIISSTGTFKKKLEYHETGQFFLSLISESETHVLYRLITQSEIFQAFFSWNFDDYG